MAIVKGYAGLGASDGGCFAGQGRALAGVAISNPKPQDLTLFARARGFPVASCAERACQAVARESKGRRLRGKSKTPPPARLSTKFDRLRVCDTAGRLKPSRRRAPTRGSKDRGAVSRQNFVANQVQAQARGCRLIEVKRCHRLPHGEASVAAPSRNQPVPACAGGFVRQKWR